MVYLHYYTEYVDMIPPNAIFYRWDRKYKPLICTLCKNLSFHGYIFCQRCTLIFVDQATSFSEVWSMGLANGKNQTSISFSTLRPLHVTLFVHSILERVMRKRYIRCVFYKKDIFLWLFRSKNNLPLQDAFVCPSTGYENWGLFFLHVLASWIVFMQKK